MDVGCCSQTGVRTDFLRCIVNIFRSEIGASFFYTTYHDFLRCIVNIFRLQIGASFFLIPRTTIFCLVFMIFMIFLFKRATISLNIFSFQIYAAFYFIRRTTILSALHHLNIHDLFAIPPLTPTPPLRLFPCHGNITVSDDFFVVAILQCVYCARSVEQY